MLTCCIKYEHKWSQWWADQCFLGALKHLSSLVHIILGSGDGEHSNIRSFRWDIDPRLRIFSYLTITVSSVSLNEVVYMTDGNVLLSLFHYIYFFQSLACTYCTHVVILIPLWLCLILTTVNPVQRLHSMTYIIIYHRYWQPTLRTMATTSR